MNSCKISLSAGIGDCIQVLSFLYPIQSFYNQNKDFKVYLTYGRINDCGHLTIIQDFCSRLPYTEWVEKENFDSVNASELTWNRPISKELGDFVATHKPTQLEFSLREDEQALFKQEFFKKPYIFIQLSSNSPQRIWDRNNYVTLIKEILFKSDYNIVLNDWKGAKELDITDNRIQSIIGSDIAFAAHIVRNAALIISTCSWNKYVASLGSVPRIILCADVTEMLGLKDQLEMLNNVFGLVISYPNYNLLGVFNYRIENNKFIQGEIIEHVNKITVSDVFRAFFLEDFKIRYKDKLCKRFNTFYKAFEMLSEKNNYSYRIVETGCIREENNWVGDGCSTFLFDNFAQKFNCEVISVDNDKTHCELAKKLTKNVNAYCEDSVKLLYNLYEIKNGIDLLYLDSRDLCEKNPHPSALHHLNELAVSLKNLKKGSLVLTDDNISKECQKGLYCRELLENIGAKIILDEYQTLWQI